MVSGGHSRSGPAPDPRSGASDRKGLSFKKLPADGYDGDVPEFPRPILHGAEMTYWTAAWRNPQAALWATPQWSFVIPAVALYCSLMAWTETPEYPIGIVGQIRGLAADILLTPDSLNRAGYTIPADEVAERRADSSTPRKGGGANFRDRLKAVGDER